MEDIFAVATYIQETQYIVLFPVEITVRVYLGSSAFVLQCMQKCAYGTTIRRSLLILLWHFSHMPYVLRSIFMRASLISSSFFLSLSLNSNSSSRYENNELVQVNPEYNSLVPNQLIEYLWIKFYF